MDPNNEALAEDEPGPPPILNDTECGPITTYEGVFRTLHNPPEWVSRIAELKPRGNVVIPNNLLPCHLMDDENICPQRLDKSMTSKTIICHDMRNGYLLDRFPDPVGVGNGYTFYMWQCIDAFIYFSHHFVTIPPLQWINVAHRNGVRIMGTILTEWTQGKDLCTLIFKDHETMLGFANAIVQLSGIFKLDGWLINIENEIKEVGVLVEFLRVLTRRMHVMRPGSTVIWYDSVTEEGELKWQNELNFNNLCFFNACDGIFLNYTWKMRNLMFSAKLARDRCLDVYVGIDVFARNGPNGSGPAAFQSVRCVREAHLSIALFAPGWTHESLDAEPHDDFFQRYVTNDRLFWTVIWPYLFTHPLTELFETNFYIGTDNLNYNLINQQKQLTHVAGCNIFERQYPEAFFRCPCLQMLYENSQDGTQTPVLIKRVYALIARTTLYHLQATCIDLFGSYVFYTITSNFELRKGEVNLDIVLVTMENKRHSRVVLYCDEERPPPIGAYLKIKCLSPEHTQRMVNSLNMMPVPKNHNLKCFWVNFPKCIQLLHIYGTYIGAIAVVLHGFGIRKME